jgi:hypothetical protein
MGISSGPNTTRDGLIFEYDHDDPKSFKGRPLTNYAYIANARTDDSYVTYENTASGSWPDNHADAITVYNESGTNISNYVNTGVTDYTNTQHAIWTYDDILKRPVVTMRDWDSEWKAKNWVTGYSMTDMGLASTDNYTISWLQWTTDTSKSINCGLYGHNNVAANGFHDGLAHTVDQTSTQNTKSHTWERVHCTFTVASDWDFTYNLRCYMYGQYNPDGTVKIADVQIEPDSSYYSGFHGGSLTRSNTEAIIDRAGGNTITATSLTYNNTADNTFTFRNSNTDYISIADNSYPADWTDNFSIEVWTYCATGDVWDDKVSFPSNGGTAIVGRGSYVGSHGLLRATTDNRITFRIRTDTALYSANVSSLARDTWHHIVGTWDGTNNKIYHNGVYQAQGTPSWTSSTSGTGAWRVGGNIAFSGNNGGYLDGDIPVVRMYNKALSDSEVKRNFDAMKSRFGL